MVNLSLIPARYAARYNMNIKTLQEQIKANIPNYKRKTIDEVINELELFLAVDEENREEEVVNRHGETARIVKLEDVKHPNENPYRFGSNRQIPRGKLKVIFVRPLDDTDEQVPLPPVRVPNNRRGRQPRPPTLPDSEHIRQLSAVIRNRFRPVFGIDEDMRAFRSSLKEVIYDLSPNAKTAQYIYSHLDIREVEVQNDDNFLLYYVMKNGYFDFGDFVIQKFCMESPSKVNHITSKEFGCFFRCCLEQAPKIFTKKPLERLAYLDNIMSGQITIEKMKDIAKEFKLNISVLDVELRMIQEYNYASIARNHSVTIVAKDNHAYSLKPEYKKSVSRDGCHYLVKKGLKKLTVDPKKDVDFVVPIIGEVYISEQPDEEDDDEETCHTVQPKSKSYELKFVTSDGVINEFNDGRDYIFFTQEKNDIIDIYTHYYMKHNIRGCLIETPSSSQLVIRLPSSPTPMLSQNVEGGGKTLYFRNREHFDYDLQADPANTFSITTLSKWWFQSKIMKEPLPKISDPIIHTILKGLCKPMKMVKCGDYRGGYVYSFDLTKAYFNSSDNLWIPNDEIVWKTGKGRVRDGVLYLTSNSLKPNVWKMDIEEDETYEAYIVKSNKTNIIREYGELLRDSLRPTDYKIFFNSLIGSMHPSETSQSHTLIFHNEQDFCRFLLIREGKNIINIDINKELDIYKVVFTYDTGYHSGFCLPYFPAQIIQRCNKKVIELRKKLSIIDGTNLLMTMTDSVVVRCEEKLSSSFIDEILSSKEWELKVKEADRIDIKAIGKYRIWKDGEVVGGTASYSTLDEFGNNHSLNVIDTVAFEDIFTTVNPYTHSLVIGEAGVGKSRWIKENYFDRQSGSFLLTASTGIAASSINAETIHSAFGIVRQSSAIYHATDQIGNLVSRDPSGVYGEKIAESLNINLSSSEINKFISNPSEIIYRMNPGKILRLQKIETIVIDEVYMCRLDTMILVDKILRIVNDTSAIFGGKKLVLVGDDRQLSSVKGEPFIGSELFKRLKMKTIHLDYNPGKSRMEPKFKLWTDYFRVERTMGNLKKQTMSLYSLFSSKFIEDAITVFFTNKDVERWNEMKRVNGKKIVDGEPIILRRNINVSKGLYNGKIGKAKVVDGKLYFVYMVNDVDYTHCLESLNFKKDYFLAYAITIHKAQGLTLSGINIGILSRLKTENVHTKDDDIMTRLLYVALSRVKSFDRIYLF